MKPRLVPLMSRYDRQIRKDKNRCVRGHEMTPLNTYIRPDGKEVCRACKHELQRVRRAV